MIFRWHWIFLGVALALSAVAPFAAPASESMTRHLIVKFKDEGSARRVLPLQNRLLLLAAERGRTLSHVRQMAMQAHVVALDRAVPLSEARAIAAELGTHADVEYAQADRWLKPAFVPNDEYIDRQRYLGNGSAAISAFAAWAAEEMSWMPCA